MEPKPATGLGLVGDVPQVNDAVERAERQRMADGRKVEPERIVSKLPDGTATANEALWFSVCRFHTRISPRIVLAAA